MCQWHMLRGTGAKAEKSWKNNDVRKFRDCGAKRVGCNISEYYGEGHQ